MTVPVDPKDFNIEALTPEALRELDQADILRYQLRNTQDNTEQTRKNNTSQLQQNKNDVDDRLINAQVGLQKAWGEAAFTMMGIATSFTGQKGQQAMKPLLDVSRQMFAMYMAIKEQNHNKYLSEKQLVGVKRKLISAGVNPSNGNAIENDEMKASLLKEVKADVARYFPNEVEKLEQEIGILEKTASTEKEATKPVTPSSAPITPAA